MDMYGKRLFFPELVRGKRIVLFALEILVKKGVNGMRCWNKIAKKMLIYQSDQNEICRDTFQRITQYGKFNQSKNKLIRVFLNESNCKEGKQKEL